MSNLYRLNDRGEPVREPDLHRWGQWFETADRRVARNAVGEFVVSTIFLGLDHGGPDDIPIIWETVIVERGDHIILQKRCGGSREQAEAQHLAVVRRVLRKEWKME